MSGALAFPVKAVERSVEGEEKAQGMPAAPHRVLGPNQLVVDAVPRQWVRGGALWRGVGCEIG